MSSETKDELIDRLIYEARREEAANKAFDDVAFERLGVNETDGRCLNIVENEGPMTAGRLAELSGLTTAAVTAVLDRLEHAGYATRVPDPDDRRKVIVEVGPKLRERAERIWGPLGKEARAELKRLSAEELRTVIEFFEASRELNERHVDRVRKLRFD